MSTQLLAAAVFGIIMGANGLANAQRTSFQFGHSDTHQLDDSDGTKHGCKGQNACKGQGGCKTDKHGCKGQNACKGQGGCRTDGVDGDKGNHDKNSCSGKGGCSSK